MIPGLYRSTLAVDAKRGIPPGLLVAVLVVVAFPYEL